MGARRAVPLTSWSFDLRPALRRAALFLVGTISSTIGAESLRLR
jgi:hypothetical protein